MESNVSCCCWNPSTHNPFHSFNDWIEKILVRFKSQTWIDDAFSYSLICAFNWLNWKRRSPWMRFILILIFTDRSSFIFNRRCMEWGTSQFTSSSSLTASLCVLAKGCQSVFNVSLCWLGLTQFTFFLASLFFFFLLSEPFSASSLCLAWLHLSILNSHRSFLASVFRVLQTLALFNASQPFCVFHALLLLYLQSSACETDSTLRWVYSNVWTPIFCI